VFDASKSYAVGVYHGLQETRRTSSCESRKFFYSLSNQCHVEGVSPSAHFVVTKGLSRDKNHFIITPNPPTRMGMRTIDILVHLSPILQLLSFI
jgi:hypothetical protein